MDDDTEFKIEERYPFIEYGKDEPDQFTLKFKTPGIEPLRCSEPHEAKNGSTADVLIHNKGMSMDSVIKVNNSREKRKTVYRSKIVQFPSAVDPQRSDWRIEKDEVFVILKKREPMNWMSLINRKGIDQYSSSSSSEEEKEGKSFGAVAPMPKKGTLKLSDLARGNKKLIIIERRSKMSDSSDDDISHWKSDFI